MMRALHGMTVAATLAGSLLVSYHSYLQDCSLLLPSALLVFSSTTSRGLRLMAVLLLLPLGYFLLQLSSPLSAAVPVGILAMMLWMTIEAWHRPSPKLAINRNRTSRPL